MAAVHTYPLSAFLRVVAAVQVYPLGVAVRGGWQCLLTLKSFPVKAFLTLGRGWYLTFGSRPLLDLGACLVLVFVVVTA